MCPDIPLLGIINIVTLISFIYSSIIKCQKWNITNWVSPYLLLDHLKWQRVPGFFNWWKTNKPWNVVIIKFWLILDWTFCINCHWESYSYHSSSIEAVKFISCSRTVISKQIIQSLIYVSIWKPYSQILLWHLDCLRVCNTETLNYPTSKLNINKDQSLFC